MNPDGRKRKERTRGEEINPSALDDHGNPYGLSPRIRRKLNARVAQGLCPACGKKPCVCKSFRVDTEERTFYYGGTERERLQRKPLKSEMRDKCGSSHLRQDHTVWDHDLPKQYIRHDPRLLQE